MTEERDTSRRLQPSGNAAGAPTHLVFTLGPAADARRHPLLPEEFRREERRLRRACLANALRAGREAGCQVVVSSPEPLDLTGADAWSPQRGIGFGARFANALQSACESGGPVVAVGADIPGLTSAHVAQALDRLGGDPDRVVVGPSPDGGFYLLAASRPLAEILDAVRWCGGDARRTLLAALRAARRPVVLLEPLADLDAPADLERWVASGPAPSLDLAAHRSALRRILASRCRPPGPPRRARTSAVPLPRRGRAPPLLAAS